MPEPVNRGTIDIVRPLPLLRLIKAELPSKFLTGFVDLGTPNLGTAWEISYISVRYATLVYKYAELGAITNHTFSVTSKLIVAGVTQAEEKSNDVNLPPNIETTQQKTFLLGLQNLPQTVRVPGGQQILLEMQLNVNLAEYEVGQLPEIEAKEGKVTMGYELLDFHGKPMRARS